MWTCRGLQFLLMEEGGSHNTGKQFRTILNHEFSCGGGKGVLSISKYIYLFYHLYYKLKAQHTLIHYLQ